MLIMGQVLGLNIIPETAAAREEYVQGFTSCLLYISLRKI